MTICHVRQVMLRKTWSGKCSKKVGGNIRYSTLHTPVLAAYWLYQYLQLYLKVDRKSLTFQKYFSSRYWTNFFPPNQTFAFSVARSQEIPIHLVFTVYKSPISYSFMFLVPFIGNSTYVFVGFTPKPAAGENFCKFSMP